MNSRKLWITLRQSMAVAALLAATIPAPASAQLGGPSITVSPTCDSDKYPEVSCVVTPVNSAGLPLTALTAQAFQVIDGSIAVSDLRVEKVVNPGVKTSYMFVTDFGMLGGSQNLQALKDAAKSVLSAVSSTDRVAMVAITGKVDVDATRIDLSKESNFVNAGTNRNDIINIVTRLGDVSGTPLYDALCKAIVLTAREGTPGSRAIVLFTDGRDAKSSVCTADDPITRANKDRIPIIAIGVGPKIEDSYLRRLATLTDGVFQTVNDASGLLGKFQETQTQFRTQYKLTFTASSPSDNQRHGFTVQLSQPSGRATDRGEYTALLPIKPELTAVAFRAGGVEVDPQKLPYSAEVTIEPALKARKLARVEYSVDGGEVKSSEQSPYSFVLRTDQLDSSRPHKLTVRAVADAQNVSSRDFEFGVLAPPPTPTPAPTRACDLLCQAQRNPGVAIPVAVVAVGLPVLLFSLIALLAQRNRRRKDQLAMGAGGYAGEGATSVSNVPFSDMNMGSPMPPTGGMPMGGMPMGGMPVGGMPVGSPGEGATSVFAPAPAVPQPTMVFGAPVGATQVFKPGLAKLAMTSGHLSGNVFPLGVPGDSETSIGRKVDGSTVRVQIDSPFVSRRHARIYAEGDQLFLADQQSASGTKLNGEKVAGPMKIKVGDKIEFADTTAEIQPI
jgi:hypothetical protein